MYVSHFPVHACNEELLCTCYADCGHSDDIKSIYVYLFAFSGASSVYPLRKYWSYALACFHKLNDVKVQVVANNMLVPIAIFLLHD
ncbi:hypothetical protein T07_13239 [Trichinella nelsoni]|uniref:Uncharacterized protein n=1 Tax=Trichinella nelsoni TaxID=6336 RepID=A0A0V0SI05_9BILA|nr:hypothetical protein T07_13239 [Trichinella nelsoni]